MSLYPPHPCGPEGFQNVTRLIRFLGPESNEKMRPPFLLKRNPCSFSLIMFPGVWRTSLELTCFTREEF